ncbi:MAG: hypothetical protein HQK67_08645 [Desulfamplus sp.]|nr:hypothetical protein [Desulfamplus sp.]
MNKEQKDEIIEELWKTKEQFSLSCNKNISQLIQLINEIAKDQGFSETINSQLPLNKFSGLNSDV